jgi:DNA-directed RNA polymerase specialized sigma24 family protein
MEAVPTSPFEICPQSAERRAADEEDVALSAFASFCRGAERHAFARLDDRGDLWQLLFTITARKARRQLQSERRAKRGGGGVRDEAAIAAVGSDAGRGIEQMADESLSPDFAVMLDDELERLMRITGDESLREIALLRLEGYSNSEISDMTGRQASSSGGCSAVLP